LSKVFVSSLDALTNTLMAVVCGVETQSLVKTTTNPEAVGEFNCYFKTILKENGGVQVLWTMLHPEH
jgi:hypothetical protein